MSKKYDITFVGHMCYDEIIPFGGKARVAPGSAVLCGAMVAARVGKKVAVVVKMAKKDESILQPMKDLGIDTYLIPSEETSYNRVLHESENVDERTMTLIKSAGLISINDVPDSGLNMCPPGRDIGYRIRHGTHEGFEVQKLRELVGRHAEFCPPYRSSN